MEADLLTLPGVGPLPERWREERVPSFRRLLVIFRHITPDSAVGRALGVEWPIHLDMLDDIRRAVLVAVKGPADLHPARPAAKRIAAEKAERTARREKSIAASRAREADRQARLTQRQEAAT